MLEGPMKCPECKKDMKPFVSSSRPQASEWHCERPCNTSVFMQPHEYNYFISRMGRPGNMAMPAEG